MNILLATTELAPLSGDTSLGLQAAALANDLHACADTDVVTVMPASNAVRQSLGDRIPRTGISISLPAVLGDPDGERIVGRFLETGFPAGPQMFLLESPNLGTDGTIESEDATGVLLWARLVVDLLVRLRPRIDLVHCFGWSSALIPLLIRGRMLPCKTVFSSLPDRADAADFDEVARAVGDAGLDEITSLLGHMPTLNSTPALVRECADRTLLTGAAPEPAEEPAPGENAAPSRKAEARTTLSQRHDLSPDAKGPLLYVPTSDPSLLLPMLDRLLATDASVILQYHLSGNSRRDLQARLITYQMRFPGKFAWFRSEPDTESTREWLLAADVILLLPADTAAPEIADAAHEASSVDCAPVVPRHDSLLPVFSSHIDEEGQPCTSAFSYRAESTESIWYAVKRCLRLFGTPEFTKRLHTDLPKVKPLPKRKTPRFHEVYREIAKSSLASNVP